MTGEKEADHILSKTLLSPSNAKPWLHPNWKTEQRECLYKLLNIQNHKK